MNCSPDMLEVNVSFKKMAKLKITTKYYKGYTLVEIVVVLAILASIIITIMTVYSQVSKAASKVDAEIGTDNRGIEILQLIAEDIDRLSVSGDETQIQINSKTTNGTQRSRMIITTYTYDQKYKKQEYEQVTWMSYLDEFDGLLYLYRSHGGIALEESMFDKVDTFRFTEEEKKTQEELQKKGAERFIPICSGMTLFEFSVPNGESESSLTYNWTSETMPKAVRVDISFEEPVEDVFGDYIIHEDSIYTRTIATNRLREIKFQFVHQDFDTEDPNSLKDPNSLLDGNSEDPNSVEDLDNIL